MRPALQAHGGFALALLLALVGTARADGPTLRWSYTLPPGEEPRVAVGPVVLRELRDGTALVVAYQESGEMSRPGRPLAIHISPSGSVLSVRELPGAEVITSWPSSGPSGLFAIADDGTVTQLASRTRRWDGRSGRPFWPEPAGPTWLGADHELAFDGNGSILATAHSQNVFPPQIAFISGLTGETRSVSTLPSGRPVRVVADPSGDAIVSHAVYFPSPDGTRVAWTFLRLAAGTGALKWATPPIDLSRGDGIDYLSGLPTDLGLDADGNVIASGTVTNTTEGRAATLKVSGRTGALLWGPRFLGPADSSALAMDSSGNPHLVVTDTNATRVRKLDGATGALVPGYGEAGSTPIRAQRAFIRDGRVIALRSEYRSAIAAFDAPSGAPLWTRFETLGRKMSSTSGEAEGSFLVGVVEPDRSLLLRLDLATGLLTGPETELWARPLPRSSARRVAPTGDGRLVAIGLERQPEGRAPHAIAARLDGQTGAPSSPPVRWGARSLELDAGGGLFVSDSPGISRYGPDEARLWGPIALGAFWGPHGFFPDRDGDVVVIAGFYDSPISFAAREMVKLDAADGTVLWRRLSPGTAQPLRLLFDGAGDLVLMTVQTTQSYAHYWEVWKLSGRDGTILWGPVRRDAQWYASRMALDSRGDVVVTRTLAGSTEPFRLTKLRGLDGGVLWERDDAEQPGSRRLARTVAVDVHDDVVIAGPGHTGNVHFAEMQKVDGETGTLLWGPIRVADEWPQYEELTVRSDGTLVLATSSSDQLAVLQLDGATGAIQGDPVRLAPSAWSPDPIWLTLVDDEPVVACDLGDTFTVLRLGRGLGLRTLQPDLVAARVGFPYTAPIQAVNAVPPLSFEVSAGALPAGLTLDPASGVLSGVPLVFGQFPFRVRATDATGTTAERELELAVADFAVPGIPGDLNADGLRDIFDLVSLMAHVVGNLPSETWPFIAPAIVADLDRSGGADLFDAVLLMGYLAGNVPSLPGSVTSPR